MVVAAAVPNMHILTKKPESKLDLEGAGLGDEVVVTTEARSDLRLRFMGTVIVDIAGPNELRSNRLRQSCHHHYS